MVTKFCVGSSNSRRTLIDFNLGQSYLGRETLQLKWAYVGVVSQRVKSVDSKTLADTVRKDLESLLLHHQKSNLYQELGFPKAYTVPGKPIHIEVSLNFVCIVGTFFNTIHISIKNI